MFNNKHRPMTVGNMIGSANVRAKVENYLDNNKFPSSSIIAGDFGLGKTTLAKIVAMRLSCGCLDENCKICKSLISQLYGGKNLEQLTNVFEFDLGKNRDEMFVDKVLNTFRIKGNKVIILDEIQNLPPNMVAKFLKTFENLEEGTHLIIATTDPYKLGMGIISRCEMFELTPPTVAELAAHLESICRQEQIEGYTREGIYMLANEEYRVRDAVKVLGSIINLYGNVNAHTVKEYYGKEEQDFPVEFLTLCKEQSPYKFLNFIEERRMDMGLSKFIDSIKTTMADSINSKYGVRPSLVSKEEENELIIFANKFTSSELISLTRRLETFRNMSNTDMRNALMNLAFDISNGEIIRKVDIGESLRVERELQEEELGTGKIGGPDGDIKDNFSHHSKAINPREMAELDKVATKIVNINISEEKDILSEAKNIFASNIEIVED